MTPDELSKRTKDFSLRVVKLVEALPKSAAGRHFGEQLLRSASSVVANYRAARRARSKKEFIAKLSIVTEEADESTFWLEMIADAQLLSARRLHALHEEAEALTHLFAKSRRTATRNSSPNHQTTQSPNR